MSRLRVAGVLSVVFVAVSALLFGAAILTNPDLRLTEQLVYLAFLVLMCSCAALLIGGIST